MLVFYSAQLFVGLHWCFSVSRFPCFAVGGETLIDGRYSHKEVLIILCCV